MIRRQLGALARDAARRVNYLRFGGNKPSFFILGAQKAGTSSLFEYLACQPGLCGASVKEVGFFDKEYRFEQGTAFYERHFVSAHPERCRFFEATPEYLYRAKVPRRIHDYHPEARFVILLREPAARAYSAWNMYREWGESGKYPAILDRDPEGRGVNPLYETFIRPARPPTFEEYVALELDLIRRGVPDEEPGLIRRGIYQPQIERYVDLFGRERVHIVGSSELGRRTAATVAAVCRFVTGSDAPVDERRFGVRHHARPYSEPPADAAMDALRAFYGPYNAALFDYLGGPVDW